MNDEGVVEATQETWDNLTFFADQISTIEKYPNPKEVVSSPGS